MKRPAYLQQGTAFDDADHVPLWTHIAHVPQELGWRMRILLDAGADIKGSAARQQLDRHVASHTTVGGTSGSQTAPCGAVFACDAGALCACMHFSIPPTSMANSNVF